jgi:transposase
MQLQSCTLGRQAQPESCTPIEHRLTELGDATGSKLRQLNGVGPAGAARLIGEIADIAGFATLGRFASWNGTAPIEASPGDQQRHRLSRAGNRRINDTPHAHVRR